MSKPSILISREAFSEAVLARFDGRCCRPGCPHPADAAHHIVERRLWADGGYYLSNGAPLCAEDHLKAEITEFSVEQMREWCGIKDVILPPQFEDGEVIDKWGNPILANGTRLRGEMFFDEQVQKALTAGGFLSDFTHWVKHAKTWHLVGSPGVTKDDRVHANMNHLIGRRVIMTEKRDGECSTLYFDHIHARSLDSRHHPSRDWLKSYWSSIRQDIPERWRLVGESLYAEHSIAYAGLETWFEGIFMWNDRNICLPWEDTLEWFSLIGSGIGRPIKPVPVLYDGPFEMKVIMDTWNGLLQNDKLTANGNGLLQNDKLTANGNGLPVQEREGFVLRVADGFAYRDFKNAVCKWVRPGHVQTDVHWMHGPVVANKLKQP